jgi:predicted ATP-dependent serine protease
VVGKNLELPFERLSDMLASAPDEPEWLWEGFLVPGAITLVAAKPKVGKSTLVMGLIPRLLAGEPFLGLETRKTVAILLTEENGQTIVEKARQFGGPEAELLRYAQVATVPWYRIVESAARHASAVGSELIVVDTLNTWAGLRGEAENAAGAVLNIVRPLKVAAAGGLAILVVAHHRKSGGVHWDAIRGSNALAGTVDIIIDVERSTLGPTTRILKAVSRFRSTPDELVVELDGDDYRVLGNAAVARSERDAEEILDAVRMLGTPTVDELSDATGIPEQTLRRRLRALGDRVSSSGSGRKADPVRWSVADFDSNQLNLSGGGDHSLGSTDYPAAPVDEDIPF